MSVYVSCSLCVGVCVCGVCTCECGGCVCTCEVCAQGRLGGLVPTVGTATPRKAGQGGLSRGDTQAARNDARRPLRVRPRGTHGHPHHYRGARPSPAPCAHPRALCAPSPAPRPAVTACPPRSGMPPSPPEHPRDSGRARARGPSDGPCTCGSSTSTGPGTQTRVDQQAGPEPHAPSGQ